MLHLALALFIVCLDTRHKQKYRVPRLFCCENNKATKGSFFANDVFIDFTATTNTALVHLGSRYKTGGKKIIKG